MYLIHISDDPSCSCQRVRGVGPLRSLELILHDTRSDDMRQLHGQHTELDAIFDIVSGTMFLKQKLRDPKVWPQVQHLTAVCFNQSNSAFVNLEGLADNSLLLIFKLKTTKPATKKQKDMSTKLKIRQQDYGFITDQDGGPLLKALRDHAGKEGTILQLRLPKNRIDAWGTVALILLTYREINPTIWHQIVSNKNLSSIAGLDWAQIREKMSSTSRSLSFGAKAKTLALNETARKAAIANQAKLVALQNNMVGQGFAGLTAMMSRPTVIGHALNTGDFGFRG